MTEAGNYECSIPWQENYNLSITTDRSVTLDNIKMYSHEQYGRIYDTDGNEQDLAAAFRELNAHWIRHRLWSLFRQPIPVNKISVKKT